MSDLHESGKKLGNTSSTTLGLGPWHPSKHYKNQGLAKTALSKIVFFQNCPFKNKVLAKADLTKIDVCEL